MGVEGAAPAPGKPRRRVRGGVGGRRVTMTDIAREAGCSQATVSFVLNRTAGIKISKQTRDRVIEAARTLGYAPASFADLQLPPPMVKTDGLIGFAVDQLATSPEAVVAIEGARQAAWGAGNIILVAQTMSDPVMEPRTIAALLAQGVSAFIYMTIFTREIVAPPILRELNVPVVLLNCYTADHAFPAVVPGEIDGSERSWANRGWRARRTGSRAIGGRLRRRTFRSIRPWWSRATGRRAPATRGRASSWP